MCSVKVKTVLLSYPVISSIMFALFFSENTKEPAKLFLDYVGDRPMGDLVHAFQAAGIYEIIQKLNISLKEEPTGKYSIIFSIG